MSAAGAGGVAALHSAPHLLPIATPPLREGAVAVRADGTIAAVGPRAELRAAYPSLPERRWEGTLLPGLVNAHTHLQYTDLAEVGAREHDGFEAWCAAFDARYPQADPDGWGDAARRGLELSLRAGVTCFGDVVTDDAARDVLRDAGVAGIAFLETLGDDDAGWAAGGRDRYLARLDAAGANVAGAGGGLAAGGAGAASACFGVSPHAPYSVDGAVLADLGRIARDCGLRLHVHLAESQLEHELVEAGSGRLAQLVAEWGWSLALLDDPAGVSPARYLDARLALGPDCHVAHGVALDADDRALLRERGCAVALCLRSNRTIGVEEPPLAAYLRERSPLCVGTDSLASAPSLDLLGELPPLRALAREQGYRDGDLDARLLHAATAGGAAALGLAHRLGGPGTGAGARSIPGVGVLASGARADLAHLAVRPLEGESPEHAVVTRGVSACTATVVAGAVHTWG
ncbi:amidohydrolase family protein [Conexibacter sp. JD483]|uniref:amidohydrolase family protein n=1 Tax=unclassified Conexibacter TaxID=2627773 RepID=UPI00271F0F20|nr:MULTISPECIES: amidohydrolase family protein [unclassified Conexibacter]MDO8188911.1 amidohydrolase family protein [Conexibacter sp. CPCC 205706]MDO8200266.1 amidohydrolase family protein [Conexibacter sp. CPCC 205762]MDR9371613.1 amidohydrolase family protein [Conexibacter sp. JD483]